MKQIKPIVIGYIKVEVNGVRYTGAFMWSAESMAAISKGYYNYYKIKPKFRPVYNGYTETE